MLSASKEVPKILIPVLFEFFLHFKTPFQLDSSSSSGSKVKKVASGAFNVAKKFAEATPQGQMAKGLAKTGMKVFNKVRGNQSNK